MPRGQSTDRIIADIKANAEDMPRDTPGSVTPFGLTAREERMAQEVAKGATLSDAYRAAYTTENMKPETLHQEASRIVARPKVAARVRHLLEEQERRLLRDAVAIKRHVMARLMQESMDTEKGNAMSRIRALELLGKVHFVGLFAKGEEAEKGERKPEEIEAELRDKLRSMFMPKA